MFFLHDVNRYVEQVLSRHCSESTWSCWTQPLGFVLCFFLSRSYFSNNEPWVLAKQLRNSSDPTTKEHQALKERLDTVLYVTIDAVRMSGM